MRGLDSVCHLAAVGDVYLAGEKPSLAAELNVVGTARVCDASLAAEVGRVLYASTWEVYGEPEYQPLDEEHPCSPDHPYSITKLAGERLALAYFQLRKLGVASLRLGTAYGTRMRPNSVFSLFIDRAVRGEPITIQGTGEQARQFTHARDIGAAFDLALQHAKPGRVYNIVAEDAVTIRDLASQVTSLIPTRLEFAPARNAEVPSARVSSARARSELHWTPVTRFADGLSEIVRERTRVAAH